MAWEVRGKKSFLYRSVKEAGKTKKRYLGGGQIGDFAYLVDKVTAADKQRRMANLRAEAGRIATAKAALVRLEAEVELLAAASRVATKKGRIVRAEKSL